MKKRTFAILRTAVAALAALALLLAALPASAVSTSSTAFEKGSRSEYVENSYLNVKEEMLWSFDEGDEDGNYAVDTSDFTEGNASGKITSKWVNSSKTLFAIANKFNVNASEMTKVTFKIDIWVKDMSKVLCDHEKGYPQNDYSHSGTFYWRLTDSAGRWHGINVTIVDNNGKAGWQTMEYTLLHNNGMSNGFDVSNITGSWMMASVTGDVEIKLDNLRVCYYSNEGYAFSDYNFPEGCRVVSDCEADSLDSAVITEWFGTSYDFENNKFGRSCLAATCTSKDDYRIFFGGLDIPMTYSADYICFWVKVPKGKTIDRWFLEANQAQDSVEYENPGWSAENITKYAVDGFKAGKWNLIQLPLTALEKHNAGENITLHHLRMVLATDGKDFPVYFDNIYLCNEKQAKAAAKEFRNPSPAPVIVFSKPVSTSEPESVAETVSAESTDDTSSANVTSQPSVSSKVKNSANKGTSPVVYVLVAVAVVVIGVCAGLVVFNVGKGKKSEAKTDDRTPPDGENTPE